MYVQSSISLTGEEGCCPVFSNSTSCNRTNKSTLTYDCSLILGYFCISDCALFGMTSEMDWNSLQVILVGLDAVLQLVACHGSELLEGESWLRSTPNPAQTYFVIQVYSICFCVGGIWNTEKIKTLLGGPNTIPHGSPYNYCHCMMFGFHRMVLSQYFL